MKTLTQNPSLHRLSKVKQISYWLVTGFITFELIYGALWDINLLNKEYVYKVLTHLGYPLYLASMLAGCKIVAAVVINLPGFHLLKEWAYAGVVILFGGAFLSHIIVRDDIWQYIWSLLFGLLAIVSYVLRPSSRRVRVA